MHVAYKYEGLVGVRPEGRLYAVAVDDIVERIKAGAIPPTRPKAAEPAVIEGQLMLANSSACLSQIDWADYLVTVRVCVKEEAASGRGGVAIFTRATPSNFGIKDVDQYAFLFTWGNNIPRLRLELQYQVASGARYGAPLGTNPCTLVPGKWYKLAFEVRGEHLRAYLDDKLVIEAMDARLSKGAPWITAAGSPVLFDDFSVRQLP
jgi:hypothetical protein